MSGFFRPDDQFVRFLFLTCGLLTLAGAVACLVLGNALLAVACCIVSAWAIGFYLDAVWTGLMRANKPERRPSVRREVE